MLSTGRTTSCSCGEDEDTFSRKLKLSAQSRSAWNGQPIAISEEEHAVSEQEVCANRQSLPVALLYIRLKQAIAKHYRLHGRSARIVIGSVDDQRHHAPVRPSATALGRECYLMQEVLGGKSRKVLA